MLLNQFELAGLVVECDPRAPDDHDHPKCHANFLKLDLASFGVPTAHLANFRGELVLGWKLIDEAGNFDLVAHCQFLPCRPLVRSASRSASCAAGGSSSWPAARFVGHAANDRPAGALLNRDRFAVIIVHR